jgi:hypothetical protein
MKTVKNPILTILMVLTILISGLYAQEWESDEEKLNTRLIERFGMRIGAAYLLPNSGINGQKKEELLNRDGIYPNHVDMLSQFGFHLEPRFKGFEKHKEIMISMSLLLSGFNYGIIIPEASFIIGWRLQNGIEFGGGPSLTTDRAMGLGTNFEPGFAFNVGYSSSMGRLIIPVNVKMVQSKSGYSISLLSGFDW